MSNEDTKHRSQLPIHGVGAARLDLTFDAKDPGLQNSRRIEQLRPPAGCAERADHPARRRGLRRGQRLRRSMPDAELRRSWQRWPAV